VRVDKKKKGLKKNMSGFSEIHMKLHPYSTRTNPLGKGKNEENNQTCFVYNVNGTLILISTLDLLPSKTLKHSMRQAITSLNTMFSLIPL